MSSSQCSSLWFAVSRHLVANYKSASLLTGYDGNNLIASHEVPEIILHPHKKLLNANSMLVLQTQVTNNSIISITLPCIRIGNA